MSYLQLDCIKKSQLMQNFGEGIDSIPPKFKKIKTRIKYEIEINDLVDLRNTLESLRFHMVRELPYEVFEYVHEHMDYEISQSFDWDLFKDFYGDQLKLIWGQLKETLMSIACRKGYFELVKYLCSKGYQITFKDGVYLGNDVQSSNNFLDAARANNLDILKFLYQIKGIYDFKACSLLVENNNYEGVEYIINLQETNSTKDYRYIEGENNYSYSTYIARRYATYTSKIKSSKKKCINIAIRNNNEVMLDLLCKHNFQWSEDTVMTCVASDNFEMLKYVVGKGCPIPFNYKIFEASARCSDTKIMKFLKEKEPRFSFRCTMFEEAIIYNRYDVLKYLHANKLWVSKEISRGYLHQVIRTGNVKMFDFLVKELKFHYSRQTMKLILEHDAVQMYESLLENGYRPKKKKDVIDIINAKKMNIIELLQTHNFDFTVKINTYLQLSINMKHEKMLAFFQKIKDDITIGLDICII